MGIKQSGVKAKPDSKMIHVRLSSSLHKSLKLLLVEKEATIQEWVEDLIKKELAKTK